MAKKTDTASKENSDAMQDIPIASDDEMGQIRINNNVVAQIVKEAASRVDGFLDVAGSGSFNIQGILTRSDVTRGIEVEEDSNQNYKIVLRVALSFGVELAKTAAEIQDVVREDVYRMTNKKVSRIDVVVESVRRPEAIKGKDEADWDAPEEDKS